MFLRLFAFMKIIELLNRAFASDCHKCMYIMGANFLFILVI